MNIEILFRDGTKLKLEGYEHYKEDADTVILLKKESHEVVTVYKTSVSYMYAKNS